MTSRLLVFKIIHSHSSGTGAKKFGRPPTDLAQKYNFDKDTDMVGLLLALTKALVADDHLICRCR